jgi:putative transposase
MQRTFSFLDPGAPLDITRRNLPHWEQPGVCYFLTFHTADSLPSHVMQTWKAQRKAWLLEHGIDTARDDWHREIETLPDAVRSEFHRTFSRRMHELLDAGHGECLLRRAKFRQITVDALHCFDNDRYLLGGFVVMPNHVHVLAQCLGETRLKKMTYSWKHFTACKIHRVLREMGAEPCPAAAGAFWRTETHDHIVRSAEQFAHYRRYIENNPVKANLPEGEYSLFLPEVNLGS